MSLDTVLEELIILHNLVQHLHLSIDSIEIKDQYGNRIVLQ